MQGWRGGGWRSPCSYLALAVLGSISSLSHRRRSGGARVRRRSERGHIEGGLTGSKVTERWRWSSSSLAAGPEWSSPPAPGSAGRSCSGRSRWRPSHPGGGGEAERSISCSSLINSASVCQRCTDDVMSLIHTGGFVPICSHDAVTIGQLIRDPWKCRHYKKEKDDRVFITEFRLNFNFPSCLQSVGLFSSFPSAAKLTVMSNLIHLKII